MTTALWIIAVCAIIMVVQDVVRIEMDRRDQAARGSLYQKYLEDDGK